MGEKSNYCQDILIDLFCLRMFGCGFFFFPFCFLLSYHRAPVCGCQSPVFRVCLRRHRHPKTGKTSSSRIGTDMVALLGEKKKTVNHGIVRNCVSFFF